MIPYEVRRNIFQRCHHCLRVLEKSSTIKKEKDQYYPSSSGGSLVEVNQVLQTLKKMSQMNLVDYSLDHQGKRHPKDRSLVREL